MWLRVGGGGQGEIKHITFFHQTDVAKVNTFSFKVMGWTAFMNLVIQWKP